MGSAITYYRRYTLQSLLGIQADDDDANKASANKKQQPIHNLPRPRTMKIPARG